MKASRWLTKRGCRGAASYVHDYQQVIDVGIEVADFAIFLDRLLAGLTGVQKLLVVDQLLKRLAVSSSVKRNAG